MSTRANIRSSISFFIVSFLFMSFGYAQERILVWSDEFDGPTIDESVWTFDIGGTNDNVHYYTDRAENAVIEEGILKIIALEESMGGYDYTAASITTKNSLSWRYGRFEARIRLPGTNGFVPAFWMLPVNGYYGWWPYSGEIDIMEHPSNQVDQIYGTVHTEEYNLFGGPSPPQGDQVTIADAESAFHVYAIEWTPDQIKWFVDDNNYYIFTNDNSDNTATWPFDQRFYLILNLAVGGGWVGDPDAGTEFPAVMEVDYVRVYQHPEEIGIQGPDFHHPGSVAKYSVPVFEDETYIWSVPNRATVLAQNSSETDISWDIFGGAVELDMGPLVKSLPVEVSPGLIKNGGFENGVRYWRSLVAFPATAQFQITDAESALGEHAVSVNVDNPGTNAWDIQLSQWDLSLEAGKTYEASFWARKASGTGEIAAALVNTQNFTLLQQSSMTLTDDWQQYAFTYTASSNVNASFNLDFGDHAGSYYFDDVKLMPAAYQSPNQISNASFSQNDEEWILNVYNPAVANGNVTGGEYHVMVDAAGNAAWDINLEQTGLNIESGETYEVSFDAYATAPRDISVVVGQNADPWTVYSGDNTFQLTERRQSFGLSFTMENASDADARLAFELGASAENVVIDNVFVENPGSLDALGEPDEEINHGFSLNVYPNPVLNTPLKLSFNLPYNTHLSLELYDSMGQLIQAIEQGRFEQGQHELVWEIGEQLPAGNYLLRLSTENGSVSKKVILVQ